MEHLKKIVCILCTFVVLFNIIVINVYAITDTDKNEVDITARTQDGGKATGVGLAAWACVAYAEGWEYSLGGTNQDIACEWGHTFHDGHHVGATDCSGLIYTYRSAISAQNITNCLQTAQNKGLSWGAVANGIPRIHGLGLYKPGHVGVYLGSYVTITKPAGTFGGDQGVEVIGNFIDERGNAATSSEAHGDHTRLSDTKSYNPWTHWYKLENAKYPGDKEFVRFNGDVFYYEQASGKSYSEFVVDCERTIDGKKYTFGPDGVCKDSVPEDKIKWSAQATPQQSFKPDGTHGSPGPIKNTSGKTVSGTSNGGTGTISSETSGSSDESGSSGTGTVEDDSKYQASRLEVSSYELTFEQEKRVDEINKDRDRREDEARWQWVYILLSLSGILILVYTILLVIVYYIDLFNSITEVSLFHKLTLGHMYPVGSKDNLEHLNLGKEDNGIVYATHTTVWKTFVFGVLSSAFLMNMRTVVILFLNLTTWFSNLISSWGS